MLRKSCLSLAMLIYIAILSGCSSGSNATEQKVSSSMQPQTKSSDSQITGISSDSISNKTNNTGSMKGDTSNEKPVAPEKNPPGDIPDTQVFVKYTSLAGSYELQVPEGWARTENGADVQFIDKFDGVQVKVLDVTASVTLDSIKNKQVVELQKTGRAIKIKSVKEENLSGIKVFVVSYDSNSDPNSVTGKQIRLENQNFYFYKNGKMAIVTVWAPLGADNVDQWKYISNNFKWRQ